VSRLNTAINLIDFHWPWVVVGASCYCVAAAASWLHSFMGTFTQQNVSTQVRVIPLRPSEGSAWQKGTIGTKLSKGGDPVSISRLTRNQNNKN
jgi:hypothetical protein